MVVLNPGEAAEFIAKNRSRYDQSLRDLIPAARAAVDALKDAGRPATACTLEAKLIQAELLDEELQDKMREAPEAFLAAVMATRR